LVIRLGERTRLACWFESLAVASRPLQRRRAETNFPAISDRNPGSSGRHWQSLMRLTRHVGCARHYRADSRPENYRREGKFGFNFVTE
jgi:hypothetical protein